MAEIARKVYVGVQAHFDPEGNILPEVIEWEDGTNFEVDKVLHITPAASLKAGGTGLQYRVRITGKESYIWLEDHGPYKLRWFVEAKQ